MQTFEQIVIAGLGLIGDSIALAGKRVIATETIIRIDINKDSLHLSKLL
jgi:prephenate dehydrogenase